MIIPDATKKTVRLAIRVDNDKIVHVDRTSLPKIRSGTVGDLILPAADIIEESDRNALEFESFVRCYPKTRSCSSDSVPK